MSTCYKVKFLWRDWRPEQSLDVVPRSRIIVTIVCEGSCFELFVSICYFFLNFKFSYSFVRGACDI